MTSTVSSVSPVVKPLSVSEGQVNDVPEVSGGLVGSSVLPSGPVVIGGEEVAGRVLPGSVVGPPFPVVGGKVETGGAPVVTGGGTVVPGGAAVVAGGTAVVPGGAAVVPGGAPVVAGGA